MKTQISNQKQLITLVILFSPKVILKTWKPSQLAHDVVTTLGFGCILVVTSDNVVTALSQRCHNVVFPTSLLRPKTNVVTTLCFRLRLSDMALTLQERRDSDVVFLTKIFFFQRYECCLPIPLFDKQNLFCTCQCKVFAQMVDIWKFEVRCLNKETECLILWSSLIRNSSLFPGDKFGRIVF